MKRLEDFYSKTNTDVFGRCKLPSGFNREDNIYLKTEKEKSNFEKRDLNSSLDSDLKFDVNELINEGKCFYSNATNYPVNLGVGVALQKTGDYVGRKGYVATLPELIAAKLKVKKSHDFWQMWHTVHTEENVGLDSKGRFYTANEPVLVVVNGGGILMPERIMKAYEDGLVNNSAKYDVQEFDDLLEGKLPDGSSIDLFSFEKIKAGGLSLSHRFGVVMPYSMVQKTESRFYKKKKFMENPLVIARAGGLENLDWYFDAAKELPAGLACQHSFSGCDASVPQGRMLFIGCNYGGFFGDVVLNHPGRFIGVKK